MIGSMCNKFLLVVVLACSLSSVLCFRLPHSTLLPRNAVVCKSKFQRSQLAATVPAKNSVEVPSLNFWKKAPVKANTIQHFSWDFRRKFATFASTAIILFKNVYTKSRKIIEGAMSAEPSLPLQPYQSFLLWASIFVFTTLFYCAENAIGKISPWTAKQYAEEEVQLFHSGHCCLLFFACQGPSSPFTVLDNAEAVTRMFITVLLTTTALDIYNQTLFVTTMSALFPNVNIAIFAMTLTVIQLFFGELMPKAIAAKNAEPLVRWLVPPLHKLSLLLAPITGGLTWLSEALIWLLGEAHVLNGTITFLLSWQIRNEVYRVE